MTIGTIMDGYSLHCYTDHGAAGCPYALASTFATRDVQRARPATGAVEVCPECDIANCKHIRARSAPPLTGDATRDVLNERGKTHGDYWRQAATADALRETLQETVNWQVMTPAARDALLMIAVKISRICNGLYDKPDHWQDIAGYAVLAADTFKKGE